MNLKGSRRILGALAVAMAAPLGAAEGPWTAPKLGPELECVLDSARSGVQLRLLSFEDPEVQRAAARALARGVAVRILMSPRRRSNRLQAPEWRARGLELRWDAESPCCYAVADGICLLQGGFDGSPGSLERPGPGAWDDEAQASELCGLFESAWQASPPALSQEQILNDELEALPDPRETQPRLRMKRRQN